MKIKTIFTILLFWIPVWLYGNIEPNSFGVIFVSPGGDEEANGSSWDKATTFSAALEFINDDSNAGNASEIWMKQGEYFINEKAFRIRNGVAVYGGFSGDESDPDSRPSVEGSEKTILTRDEESSNEDRILIIARNKSDRIIVSIDRVTITGGLAHKTVKDYPLSPTSAYRGGGIFIGNAEVNLKEVSITGNIANNSAVDQSGRGGGIYAIKSTLYFDNCIVSSNVAKDPLCKGGTDVSGTGGGIYSYISTVTLTKTFVDNNTAEVGDGFGYGGGIFHDTGDFKLIKCSVSNNTANYGDQGEGYGGGIHIKKGNFTLEDCTVKDNTATSGDGGPGYGGGINAFQDVTLLEISNSKIIDNYAISSSSGSSNVGKGGGIYANISPLSIKNSIISGNVATVGGGEGSGGGLHIRGNKTINIINTLFHSNTAGNKGGGINVESGTNITLTNLTMAHNQGENSEDPSPEDGDGIYMNNGTKATLYNCILWNNGDNDLKCEDQSNTNRHHSLIRGYDNSENHIDELDGTGENEENDNYPLFADPDNQNYRLEHGSPARSLGAPDANGEEFDLDGYDRIIDGKIDLGVYQFGLFHTVTLSAPRGFHYGLPYADNYNKITDLVYEVAHNQPFKFEIARRSGYGGNAVVKADGTTIYPDNGIYSVNIEKNLEISVIGFYALPDPTPAYQVTFEVVGEGELRVTYGFSLEVKDGDYMDENTLLTIHATPAEGYLLQNIEVNDTEIEDGGNHWIKSDTHIYVLFIREDPDPNPDPTGNKDIEKGTGVWGSSGNLHVRTDQPANLQVISINGKVVANQSLETGESMIPLPKGVYIYVLDNKKAGKIIIRD